MRANGRPRLGPCAATVVLGLGCQMQAPAESYIHATKLISVTAEVTQLGPLHPDRVAIPSEAPIAEVLPGDQLTFAATVVDPSGRILGEDDLDSLWFQCGVIDCGGFGLPLAGPEFDRDCGEVEGLTLDDGCRIGAGGRTTQVEVSALGQATVDVRVINYYGVIAYGDQGSSAAECFAARRDLEDGLEGCAFILRQVKVGPSWWLLAYAETVGLTSSIPIWQLPAPVYAQPVNRAPLPQIDVRRAGQLLGTYPAQALFDVRLGDELELELRYDTYEQLQQSYFIARPTSGEDSSAWFVAVPETLADRVYTTKSIHAVGEFPVQREFWVDEYGDPGTAEIFVVAVDDRNGETVARLNFEVGP